MFDNIPLTKEELQIFKDRIQKARNGPLRSYQANDKCIAKALCYVASHRSRPSCGTYVSSVRDGLTKRIHHEFSEEEMDSIVLACMKAGDDAESSGSFLSEDQIRKLSCWVPVLLSRRKQLLDYLDD